MNFLVFAKFLFSKDEAEKASTKKELQETHLPKLFTKLEDIKKKNGGDFLVCDKLTWADIFAVEKFVWFEEPMGYDILASFPLLKKLKSTVYNLPVFVNYYGQK